MTKRRAPLSVEQALQRIAGQLAGGVEAMAAVVERQPGTVRAWMDPDRPEDVGMRSAIALDNAFRSEGGTGSPIFEAYGELLKLEAARQFATQCRLLDRLPTVAREGGEALAALIAAAQPDATSEAFRKAAQEVADVLVEYREILPLLSGEMAQPP